MVRLLFVRFGSGLVFPRVFFPEADENTGLLLSFMTYGVAFLARPLGGVLFGKMGDAVGRKKALVATLILVGLGTFLIGCIPGYDQIGIWGGVLLVVLRLIQGLGVGGEWGGAVTLSAEHAEAGGQSKARGILTSAIQLGVPVGNLLAVGALAVMSATLSEDAFVAWGWRIPFLASALLLGVALWIRVAIDESPMFVKAESVKTPLRYMLRTHWRQVLITIGIRITSDVSYYVFAVFALAYIASTLNLPRAVGLTGVIFGSIAQLIVIPLSAWVSDRVGRRPVYIFGAILIGIWAMVAWPLIATGSAALAMLAIAVGVAFQGIVYGPMAAFIAEMFDTRVRSTGVSFGYQIAGVLGGALAPTLAQILLTTTGSITSVAIYVLITVVIAIISAALSKETRHTSLETSTNAIITEGK